MRSNPKTSSHRVFTHEGAPAAANLTPEQQLRRSVLSCLLWEDEFYETGVEIADRIGALAQQVEPELLARLAVEARSRYNLRHVPLLLLVHLIKTGKGSSMVSDAIARTIQRADELSELLAIYWIVNGKDAPLAKQLKLGLALAFAKFDRYALGRYNTARDVKLRDVLFLVHGAPGSIGVAPGSIRIAPAVRHEKAGKVVYARGATRRHLTSVYQELVDQTLEVPDTWEKALSGATTSEAKRDVWVRLLNEGKLGYLALLRNLRNMDSVGVDPALVDAAIVRRGKGAERVLPFRFVAAVRAAPRHAQALDQSLQASMAAVRQLPGTTVVLVDVSQSMESRLSGKSDLRRADAAAALGALVPGERVRAFSFSDDLREVPAYRGLPGIDQILNSQPSRGTRMFDAIAEINARVPYDRLIVITDEQSHPASGLVGYRGGSRYYEQSVSTPTCPDPEGQAWGYMINVASAKNGVGYGRWVHIDGFSEAVLTFIAEHEAASRT